MTRWEYKVASVRVLNQQTTTELSEDLPLEAILDRYGRQGWELVAVVGHTYQRATDPAVMYGYTLCRCHFKRAMSEKPAPPRGAAQAAR